MKNLNQGVEGAEVDDLLQLSYLQRLARQKVAEMEVCLPRLPVHTSSQCTPILDVSLFEVKMPPLRVSHSCMQVVAMENVWDVNKQGRRMESLQVTSDGLQAPAYSYRAFSVTIAVVASGSDSPASLSDCQSCYLCDCRLLRHRRSLRSCGTSLSTTVIPRSRRVTDI